MDMPSFYHAIFLKMCLPFTLSQKATQGIASAKYGSKFKTDGDPEIRIPHRKPVIEILRMVFYGSSKTSMKMEEEKCNYTWGREKVRNRTQVFIFYFRKSKAKSKIQK